MESAEHACSAETGQRAKLERLCRYVSRAPLVPPPRRHLPILTEGPHRMHAFGHRHCDWQRKAQAVVRLDRLLVLDSVLGVFDRLADTLPGGSGDEVEGRLERPN
jgi:hypothetical protein